MGLVLLNQCRHLARRYVLVRIDCNVPLVNKKIADVSRLKVILPTVRWLERKRVRIILAGHLDRPAGKVVPGLSLRPVGHALGKILRRKVKVMPLNTNRRLIQQQAKNYIVLLENLRFAAGEEANDKQFAAQLAQLADIYVNEAFSVSHRRAASLVGITELLPSYAGWHLAHEVAALQKIRWPGAKPVVFIIGGAKVADKLPVIEKLLPRLGAVLVGGGVANTFLAAKGFAVGTSLVDKKIITLAKRLLRRAGKKIILPVDVIVAAGAKAQSPSWRLIAKVVPHERIIDLGAATTQLYAGVIKQARTIFWSGPLGVVELAAAQHATLALGRLASARAGSYAYVVVGGGETAAFFNAHQLWVDHISSAGGALLEFLAGSKLPALKALGYRS